MSRVYRGSGILQEMAIHSPSLIYSMLLHTCRTMTDTYGIGAQWGYDNEQAAAAQGAVNN